MPWLHLNVDKVSQNALAKAYGKIFFLKIHITSLRLRCSQLTSAPLEGASVFRRFLMHKGLAVPLLYGFV